MCIYIQLSLKNTIYLTKFPYDYNRRDQFISGGCQITNSNQILVVSIAMWEERGEIWGILMALRMENTVKCQQEFTL